MATPAPSATTTLGGVLVNSTMATLGTATMRLLANATETSSIPGTDLALDTLPPLPQPPIFDAPFNPYLGALAQALQGMNSTQQMKLAPYIIKQMLAVTKEKTAAISHVVIGGFALVLLFSLVLLAYIRYNRTMALKGDSEATRKIILPAFEPLLWVLAALTAVYVAFFSAAIQADFMTVRSTVVTIEVFYSTKQFLYLLVPIYMLQKSLSVPALWRACVTTFFVSFYTVPVCWLLYIYGNDNYGRLCYFTLYAVRWLTFIPMIGYCLHPPSRASRRTICEYVLFYSVLQVMYVAAAEAFRQGEMHLASTLGWVTVAWNGTCPFFMWRLLKADTDHWRGMGKRAVELQTLFRRNGKVEERISAKGLHVLIEFHRKYIIDFAHLDIQEKLSETENAMVFKGKIHGKTMPVAIKVYTPETFDEDTVATFSHEAALCGALRHPNIVTFYGMCVCPPTICLVTEFCQGSLKDVTLAVAKKAGQNPQRQQFLINIGYMIDAARAIAYLHSFSPAFVHRDIKPGSFLVDKEGSVKLTDFGASRTISARSTSGHQHENEPRVVSTISMNPPPRTGLQVPQLPASLGLAGEVVGSLHGSPEYLAPELIRSKNAGAAKYGEAADIYALAMTMWDILYPGAPKCMSTGRATMSSSSTVRGDHNRRESEIYESVFAGQRPHLDERVYQPLRELIEQAWHGDPRKRPSAKNIVTMLEQIQEETCALYSTELIQALQCGLSNVATGNLRAQRKSAQPRLADVAQVSFTGAQAIEKMYTLQHITAEHEAVRIGNMLMDAGLLHHIKHARSFEYSTGLYYFDEEQISLCQPLAILEEGGGPGSTEPDTAVAMAESSAGRPVHAQQSRVSKARGAVSSSDASGSQYYHHQGARGRGSSQHGSNAFMSSVQCPCRKLGQKIESSLTARNRLRMKFKATAGDHLVTARLLADEPLIHEMRESPANAYNRMGQMA